MTKLYQALFLHEANQSILAHTIFMAQISVFMAHTRIHGLVLGIHSDVLKPTIVRLMRLDKRPAVDLLRDCQPSQWLARGLNKKNFWKAPLSLTIY